VENLTSDEKNGASATPPKELKRQRGRNAKVTYKDWSNDAVVEKTEMATFHCWGVRIAKQSDKTPKGPPAMETVGICELENGQVRLVKPEKILFTDRA
jgi:hypothetical protein